MRASDLTPSKTDRGFAMLPAENLRFLHYHDRLGAVEGSAVVAQGWLQGQRDVRHLRLGLQQQDCPRSCESASVSPPVRLPQAVAFQHLALRAAERVRWGVQLCLEMREHLQAEGLRVWQQATSIPKDSDSKRRSSLCVFSPTSRICLHHGHSQMRQLLLAQTGSQNGTRTRAPPRRSCASSTPTTSSRPTA